MQFIANNTSIPVPKVYCAFRHKEKTYIVMERIDGEMLGQGWFSRTKESKEHLLRQLRRLVAEMREIPALQDPKIASVIGGTLYDQRLPKPPGNAVRFRPFDDVATFHRFLRRGVEANSNHLPEGNELINLHSQKWPTCFTHADSSSLNILVRADNIVGIVDWETAGWYPSYWEYTMD